MPVQFLSEADHARLSICPDAIAPDDLDTYFQLNAEDLVTIGNLRGDSSRLGFALQLCCLRYLGFFPTNLLLLHSSIVGYVAEQLLLSPAALADYGNREPTLYDHQKQVLAHLSYRRATPLDLLTLDAWLLERALEHDRPKHLFDLVCDYLRRERIVRPGTTRLTKRVGWARSAASQTTFERLAPFLSKGRRTFLDGLLTTDDASVSRLAWLQHTPKSNKTSAIVETLAKIAFLQEQGVSAWDLGVVNLNRRKWLARKGAKARVNSFRHLNDETRYPQLAAFVEEALYTFTDALLDMFDVRMWELHGECRREFKNDRLAATQTINETMHVLSVLGRRYLDVSLDDMPMGGEVKGELTDDVVRLALKNAEHLTRPEDDAFVDYFSKKHRQVQIFSKQLLAVMVFQRSSSDGGLLEGLKLIDEIHAGTKRKLPTTAPTGFIPPVWKPEVFGEEGLNWRSYEIAALWVLREKLRSGDVYVASSRRYLQLERYLIPKSFWREERRDVTGLLGAPLTAKPRLAERQATFARLAVKVDGILNNHGAVRREENRLIVSPLEADEDPLSLVQFRKLIDERLPRVNITELLIAVDNLTGFSDAFRHLDGVALRGKSLLTQFYACLLAQACNLGFKQMATSADLPFKTLLWCNRWYLRDETLDEAVKTLVNYHHSLSLSSIWGGGMLSSSDGQRFPVSGDTRRARALPRYFGYGKGVTAYSWTSDQLSQFGSKVIPSTIRDATYVLDEILGNETDLDIAEHTSDTAGYTELIFGLFGLLGLTFSPRIRDLADQQLYRPQTLNLNEFTTLRPHISKVLNETQITENWDEMLRVALSLKKGYCTASLLISKLQAYPRQHPITRALQEYGRFEKTIHILRWYADPATRKRVSKQLNKGEALHALRKIIVFGKYGEIPGMEDEALDQQFACLNLVINAVIVFNTVHITRIVQELRAEGHEIKDEDLERVWPARHGHINFLGKYFFDAQKMRNP